MPLADCPPFSTIGTPPLIQVATIVLSSDVTTTSTSFVDLLTVPIQTCGGSCFCAFSVSGSNASSNTNVFFALMLDGVYVRGTKYRQDAGSGAPASLVCEVTPTAGAHTIKIQWAVSAGTGRIRAASVTEEHATLLVEELTR